MNTLAEFLVIEKPYLSLKDPLLIKIVIIRILVWSYRFLTSCCQDASTEHLYRINKFAPGTKTFLSLFLIRFSWFTRNSNNGFISTNEHASDTAAKVQNDKGTNLFIKQDYVNMFLVITKTRHIIFKFVNQQY